MRLYHLTNVHHLIEIEEDGFLEVTESNIGAPLAVDGEYLPEMVGVILPSNDGLDDSDPSHPDWVPTSMPAAIYRQMYEDGAAPRMIDPAHFNDLLQKHGTYKVVDGRPSVGMRLVLGWDGNKIDLSEPYDGLLDVEKLVGDMERSQLQFGEHIGPDVVWLTNNPAPRQGWQSYGREIPYVFAKHAVLFTVEVPDEDVLKWSDWARQQNILDWWYDQLDESGDFGADNWYVVPRRIPKSEWVSIHNTETGSVYWTAELGHVEGDDRFVVPLPHFWVHHPLSKVV